MKRFIIIDPWGEEVNTVTDEETGSAKIFTSQKEAEEFAKENCQNGKVIPL